MRSYADLISLSMRSAISVPLEELTAQYRSLCERGPLFLEHKLLETFPKKPMEELGLPPFSIYRGLPRLHLKSNPSVSKISPLFSHLPSLKRMAFAKSLFSLYRDLPLLEEAQIGLLAKRGSYAAFAISEYIEQKAPRTAVRIAWLDRGKDISAEDAEMLSSCSLILEVDSSDPSIRNRIEKISRINPLPVWEKIGAFGTIERGTLNPSGWVHGRGLHFLERGILASTAPRASQKEPDWIDALRGNRSLEEYRTNTRLFAASFASEEGVFIFVHALLKAFEQDSKDIDICVFNSAPLVSYFAKRIQERRDLLKTSPAIKQLICSIGSQTAIQKIGSEGKNIRFFCPQAFGCSDLRHLMQISEPFTVCSDEASFSEAVMAQKMFFIDPQSFPCSFIKDLLALSENRIAKFPAALQVLRASQCHFKAPCEDGELYADESIFQLSEEVPLEDLAERAGRCLDKPDAREGFKQLSHILIQEHNCLEFLIHLIQRGLCHRSYPLAGHEEEKEVEKFIYGRQRLGSVIQAVNKVLFK